MRYKMTAAVLFGCLLLTGCNGGEDSAPDPESTTIAVTAAATETAIESGSETTAAASAFSERKMQESTAPDHGTDIVISVSTAASAHDAPGSQTSDIQIAVTETESSAAAMIRTQTTAAETSSLMTETETSSQTTAHSSETGSGPENGNILTDDGLNWSPLVPVD